MRKKQVIAIFAFHQCQLLDVTGPASVFGLANSIAGRQFYELSLVSPQGGLIKTSCNVSISTLSLKSNDPASIDTMLISGGGVIAMQRAIANLATRKWIGRCIEFAGRYGSICSGTRILAELGALEGLRVTTHWSDFDTLSQQFPDLSVDRKSLFVVSGRAWTSAGVSTGIDMALAMVEHDLGGTIADKVAKFLVLHARRPGYQSQFSEILNVQITAGSQFTDLIAWLQGHLDDQLSSALLAERCNMSERTFYRKFHTATGQTPAQFIRNARLDAACILLATKMPLKVIAKRIGLSSTVHLNTYFKQKFGITPSIFRKMHHA